MEWIENHPAVVAAVWPLLTLILTALFKPRTPEQYAAMPPRLAAFFKLLGALGLDGPNVVDAIRQGINGDSKSSTEYRADRKESP